MRLRIDALEVGLRNDANEEEVLRHLGECRASLNRMLAHVTRAGPTRGRTPAWKESAARILGGSRR